MTSKFFEQISDMLRQAADHPKHSLASLAGKTVVLYGCGALGTIARKIIESLVDCKLSFWDDDLGDKKLFMGQPVYTAGSFPLPLDQRPEAVVLLAAASEDSMREMKIAAVNNGYVNIYPVANFYEIYYMHDPLKNLTANYYIQNHDRILKAANLFHDSESRHNFFKFIELHTQKSPIHFDYAPLEELYFPKDISLNYKKFVDAGTHDGQTSKELYRLKGPAEWLIWVEPDPRSWESLNALRQQESGLIANCISIWPCALWADFTQLYFASDGHGSASSIQRDGKTLVQCAPLDALLGALPVTMIKMDIEGSELEAVKGCRQTIKLHKPDLAISVYHRPEHVWDIVLYLDNLQAGYTYYLRAYTKYGIDSILYATVE